MKGAVGVMKSLELSFRFKDKDKLVSGNDEVLNDFVVCKEPKADLVLGIIRNQFIFHPMMESDISNFHKSPYSNSCQKNKCKKGKVSLRESISDLSAKDIENAIKSVIDPKNQIYDSLSSDSDSSILSTPSLGIKVKRLHKKRPILKRKVEGKVNYRASY
ncbi:4163_t:CDS:2 [Ambispora gerdemannii]|uniref:4163_t:CDS:1 n=1 Tax=Ambispora gerdemannii TaxID=144530 RepID=A0A9N9CUJ1_9GLOM|nr:4163_t:CDS:2 [Ambispora gerdemannii]